MPPINRPGSLGRKPLASRLAPGATLALAAFALAAGCGRRGSGCGRSGELPPTPPAPALSSAPLVVRCFWGCIDLNRGKPIAARELEHNCEERCVEICTKGCITEVTQGGLGTPQIEEKCEEGCEKQVERR